MKIYPGRGPRKMAFVLVGLFLLVEVIALTALVNLQVPPRPEAADRFNTLPPGSRLPSESECAALVYRSSWEPRLDNYSANHSVPTARQIAALVPWGPNNGLDPKADTLRQQITGNFTGTTDEILQWAGCKWGIDANLIRAQSVQESTWHQGARGDWTADRRLCPPDTWDGMGCYQSYGILQIKYIYSPSAWPMSRDDTAFNVDYVYSRIRACYEGWASYLYERTPVSGYPRYHAGDIWGCIGSHFSGGWYDQGAIYYINKVKTSLANEVWLHSGF